MNAAVDLYIPARWNHTIRGVLRDAGFDVTTRDRGLPHGRLGRTYFCTRHGQKLTLSRVPLASDPNFFFLLGIAGSNNQTALRRAQDALTGEGALDTAGYNRKHSRS